MSVVIPIKTLNSASIQKKIGRPNGYGQAVFAFSRFGQFDNISGIYQMRQRKGGRICVKEKFYWPTQETEGPQEESRQLFKDAVEVWQNLSENTKNQIRAENPYRHMSGYNYFIKKYFELYWS